MDRRTSTPSCRRRRDEGHGRAKHLHAELAGAACSRRAGALSPMAALAHKTRSSRSPAASSRGRGRSHRVCPEPLSAVPAALPCRARRGWRSISLGSQCRSANDGRGQPGQSASASPSQAASGRGSSSTCARRPTIEPSCKARRLIVVLESFGTGRRWLQPPPLLPCDDPVRAHQCKGTASAARDRLPARADGAGRGGGVAGQHPGRRRHPAAGSEPGRRVPALVAAGQPASSSGRHRLRHAGAERVQCSRPASGCGGGRAPGHGEHSAYQSDNQFVLEVRPMKLDPNKLTQGPGFRARSCR